MSVLAILLLIVVAIVVVFALVALLSEESTPRVQRGRQRIDDHYSHAVFTQDRDLANFLVELHRENRETYRRIKEAGRKA